MARTASGKQRIERIINKQKNGERYVYERVSEYDKEKRYYRSVSTKLLGIMKPGSDDRYDLLPTRPKSQPRKGLYGDMASAGEKSTFKP